MFFCCFVVCFADFAYFVLLLVILVNLCDLMCLRVGSWFVDLRLDLFIRFDRFYCFVIGVLLWILFCFPVWVFVLVLCLLLVNDVTL